MKLLALIIGCAPFLAHSIRFHNKQTDHDTSLLLQNHQANARSDRKDDNKSIGSNVKDASTGRDKGKGDDKRGKTNPKLEIEEDP